MEIIVVWGDGVQMYRQERPRANQVLAISRLNESGFQPYGLIRSPAGLGFDREDIPQNGRDEIDLVAAWFRIFVKLTLRKS